MKLILLCALAFGCAAADPEIEEEMPKHRLPPTHFPEVFEHDESHTLFDDFTMRAARQVHRANPSLPMFQQVPLRTNPMWDGNNELGFEVPFAPSANNRQMVLKLGEWDHPMVWSVMLSMDLPPDANIPVGGFAVQAEVQAGSGGTVDTFNLDWNRGVAFSVVCNALIINALYTNVINIPDGLILRAIAGQKPLAGTNPSLTVNTTTPTLDFTFIPIPKYATDVQVLVGGTGDPYSNLVSYSFLSGPGTTATGFIRGDRLLTFGGSVEIPGSANFMGIGNGLGTDLDCNIRFALGL